MLRLCASPKYIAFSLLAKSLISCLKLFGPRPMQLDISFSISSSFTSCLTSSRHVGYLTNPGFQVRNFISYIKPKYLLCQTSILTLISLLAPRSLTLIGQQTLSPLSYSPYPLAHARLLTRGDYKIAQACPNGSLGAGGRDVEMGGVGAVPRGLPLSQLYRWFLLHVCLRLFGHKLC